MIRWEDENGKEIDELSRQEFDLIFEMMSLLDKETALRETKCLQFIDAWGDTTFNQHQISVLIDELKSTLPLCQDEEKRKEFERVIEFIKKADGETHTYIKFWGD